MQLNLNNEEGRVLSGVLEAQLTSLRTELAHTDDRDYRRALRKRLDSVEGIASQLDKRPAESQTAGG